MGFWSFYGQVVCRAFQAAWDAGHTVHFLGILIEGALAWLGWNLGKYELAVAMPLFALIGAFVLGCVWQAYAIYRQEHRERIQERTTLQEKINELHIEESRHHEELHRAKTSDPQRNAMRNEIARFISQFESLDAHLAQLTIQDASNTFVDLDHRICKYFGDHLSQYKQFQDEHIEQVPRPSTPTRMTELRFRIQARIFRLKEVLEKILG